MNDWLSMAWTWTNMLWPCCAPDEPTPEPLEANPAELCEGVGKEVSPEVTLFGLEIRSELSIGLLADGSVAKVELASVPSCVATFEIFPIPLCRMAASQKPH